MALGRYKNLVAIESWPFEHAVREVVELLAHGDYAAVERLSGGIRLTAGEMAAAVAGYPGQLVVSPAGAAPIGRRSRVASAGCVNA